MASMDVDQTPPDRGSSIISPLSQKILSPVAWVNRNKQRTDWSSIYDILIILWPGMPIAELKKTFEVVYGFSATIDHYREKLEILQGVEKDLKEEKLQGLQQSSEHEKESKCLDIDQACQARHAGKIEDDEPELKKCSDATSIFSDTQSPLMDSDEDLGCLDLDDLAPQTHFLYLLGDLWDSTLDLASRKDRGAALYHAVKAMVNLLVDVSTPTSNYSMAIEYPDDLLLVQKICRSFSSKYPDLAGELLMSIERLPSWSSTRAALLRKSSYSGGSSRVETPPDSWNNVCEGGLGSLINCCQCGAGPYLRALYVGCVMDNCVDHKFCESCNDVQ